MASISKKSSNKVPMIIFLMLLAGSQTHNNTAFLWVRVVFMGSIMGSQNIMGSDYGSNISANNGQSVMINGKRRMH
jgi:hypothetical protein